MPHTTSAAKRLRKSEKRRRRNRVTAKKLKAHRKSLDAAISGRDAVTTETEMRATQAALDRAAAKGYIHANKAARLKSRNVKRLRLAIGQVPPTRHDPTPRRKWKSIMSKFKNRLSEAQGLALSREDATLDATYPGEYVAYTDTWAGEVLTRRVLAHATDSDAFQQLLAGIDPTILVELTHVPEADQLTVQSFQFT